mmetsp:Transcript_120643/g.348605  ORF Transcript_120643/g.348605 Transcript_120643/m.348605 type:complete len:206 (+) Transcript_120643:614-1231(+)
MISSDDCHRKSCSTELGIDSEVSEQITFNFRNSVTDSCLQISRPRRVPKHFCYKLISEPRRYVIPMLPVSIQDGKDQTVGAGVIRHDQRVLVLLSWVVRRMPLLGNTRILSNGTSDSWTLILLLGLFHDHILRFWLVGLDNTVDILTGSSNCQPTAHFLELLPENATSHAFGVARFTIFRIRFSTHRSTSALLCYYDPHLLSKLE